MFNDDFNNFLSDFYTIFCNTQTALYNLDSFEEYTNLFKNKAGYKELITNYPQYKDIAEIILSDSSFFKHKIIDEMALYEPLFDEDPFFWENAFQKEGAWTIFVLGKLIEKDLPYHQELFKQTFLEKIDNETTFSSEFFFGFEKLIEHVDPQQKKEIISKMLDYSSKVSTGNGRKEMVETIRNLIKIYPEYKNDFANFLKKEVQNRNIHRNNSWDIMTVLKENNFFKNENGIVSEEFKPIYGLRFLNKEEFSFLFSNQASPWTRKNIGTYQKTVHQLIEKLIEEEQKKRSKEIENFQQLISHSSKNQEVPHGQNINSFFSFDEKKFDKQAFRKNPLGCQIYQENKNWLVPCAFYATDVFGDGLSGYLQKTSEHMSIHDALYFLALKPNMSIEKNRSLGSFLQKNIFYNSDSSLQLRPKSELTTICHRWDRLSTEEEKVSYKDVLAKTESLRYLNVCFPAFAKEAAHWGVSENKYKTLENIYKSGLKVPTPFNTKKEFKSGNWTARFLPREDPRVGFFGFYTNCCQSYEGVGESCAISSVRDTDSQLFVIERNGEIFGGSWTWQNTISQNGHKYKAVCFDSIEALGELKFKPELMDLYRQAGNYLLQEENVQKVTIGGIQDTTLKGLENVEAIPLPDFYGQQYTDAKRQVLLCQKEKQTPKTMPVVISHHQKRTLEQEHTRV